MKHWPGAMPGWIRWRCCRRLAVMGFDDDCLSLLLRYHAHFMFRIASRAGPLSYANIFHCHYQPAAGASMGQMSMPYIVCLRIGLFSSFYFKYLVSWWQSFQHLLPLKILSQYFMYIGSFSLWLLLPGLLLSYNDRFPFVKYFRQHFRWYYYWYFHTIHWLSNMVIIIFIDLRKLSTSTIPHISQISSFLPLFDIIFSDTRLR